MSMHMPFTPRAQPGESPLSLLRRAAHGNGLRSTLRYAHSFNPQLDHSGAALGSLARNPEIFRGTARLMGIPDRDIEAVVYARTGWHGNDRLTWNGHQVTLGALTFRQAKMCVACLQEKGYALSEWDHRAAVACQEHRVLLETGCPICRAPWTHDEGLLACSCSLEEMRHHLVSVDESAASLLSRLITAKDHVGLTLLTVVEQVLAWWSKLGPRIPPLAKAVALSDLYEGRWPSTPWLSAKNGQLVHPRTALAALLTDALPEAQNLTRKLLQQSPPAMLSAAPLDAVVSARKAMQILGVKRVPFAKLCRDGRLQVQAEGYSVGELNRILTLTAGHPSKGLTPINGLRSGMAPVSLSKVLEEIEAGHITSYWSAPDCGLEGLQVDRLPHSPKASPADLMTLADAGIRLEIHPECVRSAIRVGLLPATRGAGSSSTQWLVHREHMEHFDAEYVFASTLAKALDAPTTTFASRLRSAGLLPVSGPGIDGGLTFLFRRSHIAQMDLAAVASSAYCSPAGRKRRLPGPGDDTLTWVETAQRLHISSKQLQQVVANGWLNPTAHTIRRRRFDPVSVRSLERRLANDYCPLSAAAAEQGQSSEQFRRCWVNSGVIKTHRFADQYLVAVADLDVIRQRRAGLSTGAEIGQLTGRSRTLCSNLEKIGVMQIAAVVGEGQRRVKLYSRSARVLDSLYGQSESTPFGLRPM